jgi:hypothetical protein
MGITDIKPMNKNNQEFRMIREICKSKEAIQKLINEGVKLDYYKLKEEEFKKQIRPIQCYNCQKFYHIAINCTSNQVCQRCGGNHLKKEGKLCKLWRRA